MAVHVLGFHSGYRCRHAGVCCKSGWTIPVEAPLYRTLQAAIAWGHLRLDADVAAHSLFQPAEGLAHGEPVVLRHKPDGSCVFFEPQRGNRCAIQRQMDHGHLPSACRHFPRVVVLDPRGTFITLSHVCPTAARMLIAGGSADVVAGAPGFDEHAIWEGLDARDALPPLVQPGVLWDWEAWDIWERAVPNRLAASRSPEAALADLETAVQRVAVWRPGGESLIEVVEAALQAERPSSEPVVEAQQILDLERLVSDSVPPDLRRHLTNDPLMPAQLDVPGWSAWRAVVGRYLAARSFAGWVGYHGSGLLTWYKSILAAYAVLRAACARASLAADPDAESAPAADEFDGRAEASPLQRTLDERMMVEALGNADRLLIHMASAADLAAALDEWELRR
jgi:Fe-S-cluster containining protein